MTTTPECTVCQRCGAGFVVTSAYMGLLKRHQEHVRTPPQCPTCYLANGPLPKVRGTVKWFHPRRQYGFIDAQSTGEVFFHQTQVLKGDDPAPPVGQVVRFHVRHSVKGPEAMNVEREEA